MSDCNFYPTDCETILSHIKQQEKQLKLKRRWLMGLPTSESEQKQSKDRDFLSKRSLPESLLREDDMFYEAIKTRVKKAFGAGDAEKEHCSVQVDMSFSDPESVRRDLFSCLDSLTNKGLYLLATILMQGSDKFEKTRRKMKKVIKEYLPKVTGTDVFKQLSQLLNDPQNFRDNSTAFFTPASQSPQDAAAKVLAGLEDLPKQTLLAMHRKLRGIQGSVPRLHTSRCGWNRDGLVNQVRKTGEAMLSELDVGDKLQEPLARALAIVGLSLKLRPGYQNSSVEFRHFSPEVQALQNDIVKAILLLKTEVRIQKLRILQPLLDPNAKLSIRRLRGAIKRMLTEYLFECSDMNAIPKSLFETLDVINKNSRNNPPKCFTKEETKQEVECILNVSAQTKQIVLDTLVDCEFDQDFADAYMEDLEESDDGDSDEDTDGQQQRLRNSVSGNMLHSVDSHYYEESIGESKPNYHEQSTSSTNRNGSPYLTPQKCINVNSAGKREPEYFTDADSVDPYSLASSSLLQESMGKYGTFKTNESLITPLGRPYENNIKRCKLEYDTEMDPASPPNVLFSNLSCGEEKSALNNQSDYKNQYLAIQEVCDDASIIAYNFIGHMLENFAEREGLDLDWTDTLYLKGHYSIEEEYQEGKHTSPKEDVGSVIARLAEELISSLPKSKIERLKELMSL